MLLYIFCKASLDSSNDLKISFLFDTGNRINLNYDMEKDIFTLT